MTCAKTQSVGSAPTFWCRGWTRTGPNPDPTKTGAWAPEQVVDFMMDALGEERFYIICPDGETSEAEDHSRILWGAEDITEGRPTPVTLAPGLGRGLCQAPLGHPSQSGDSTAAILAEVHYHARKPASAIPTMTEMCTAAAKPTCCL